MDLRIKRAYEPAARTDGRRILVDRLWPRGVSKEKLDAEWMKAVAPSAELRIWYGHEPSRWDGFRERYFAELDAQPEALVPLREALKHGRVTLVYGARDPEHNQAVALAEYLKKHRGR
ncbi:DUF488 domain-containing protein [Pseudoxanthomonas sp. z9]|uniref:DUF488 domain-containing protein n=1 Tax=Pseudoxanthomonas sp. z9 TaxID=2584942 RepID=UPI0011439C7F|nr:DUF488 domain-containing protein [Pseudoxanthomonas sp. z9]